MNDSLSESERALLTAYIEGTPVEHEPRDREASTVLSVRVSRALLRDLTSLARTRNQAVGRVARELIEDGVSANGNASPETILASAGRVLSADARLAARVVTVVEGTIRISAQRSSSADRQRTMEEHVAEWSRTYAPAHT